MISVENSNLLFEALLVITITPLTATNYKPCFRVILSETKMTIRLGSVLCHTSMKQTWKSTHTQYWKTDLKEHSAILVQNRLGRVLCHSITKQTWQSILPHYYKTDLAEYTVLEDRLSRALCHTSTKQTWQSTLPHYRKTHLAEYSATSVLY